MFFHCIIYGFAQNNLKNEIGLGGFANFASFSQKDGRWAAGGVRVNASRYISSKLFFSGHYGIGHKRRYLLPLFFEKPSYRRNSIFK